MAGRIRSTDPKRSIELNEIGQDLYDDCVDALSDACMDREQARVHATKVADMMIDGKTEEDIRAWLKTAVDKIIKG